jgi:two-component sensor histidine kinase
MVTGFEEITSDLNADEEKILELIVSGFAGKRGVKRAMTNKEICDKINNWIPSNTWGIDRTFVLREARVRAIIHQIRITNRIPLLLSSSSGYFIAAAKSEVKNTLNSLDERIRSIQLIRDALAEQFDKHGDSLIDNEDKNT